MIELDMTSLFRVTNRGGDAINKKSEHSLKRNLWYEKRFLLVALVMFNMWEEFNVEIQAGSNIF